MITLGAIRSVPILAQLADAGSLTYKQVVEAVEKNLNIDEMQADVRIEYSNKVWTAHLYSWGQDGTSWKVAKFYSDKGPGTIFRKVDNDFSQHNPNDAAYFPLPGSIDAGVFGTDYSFRDILEFARLTADYNQVTFETVKYQGTDCYHLVMQARPGKKPYYNQRELWVDQKTLAPRKMILRGSTGQPIKTIEIEETQPFRGINYPVKLTVISGSRNSTTKISITNLAAIDPGKVRQFQEQ